MASSASLMFERIYTQFSLPIVMKEMRARMRGVRTPTLLFAANALAMTVGLMIIVFGLQGMNLLPNTLQIADGPFIGSNVETHLAIVGSNLMLGLLMLEMLLCALITPGLTAGAFSTEREQRTLDLLLLTPLSSSNIVFAKLVSAIGFVALILLSVVPIAALSFLFGGVSPWQFLLALLLLLDMTVCFSAIGLLCSIRFLKTSIAYTVSYCMCLAWLALLPFTFGLLQSYRRYASNSDMDIMTSLALTTALLLVLATVPTVFTAMIIRLIRGRPAARATNLSVWGAFASVACLLLCLPGALDMISGISGNYFLFANPGAALVIILGGAADLPFTVVNQNTQNTIGFQIIYVTAAIGLLALGAWGAYKLTEREVERLRRPQAVGA